MQRDGTESILPKLVQRARELFEAASGMHGQAREAFLLQECGLDTELLALVERMLQADVASHRILDQPFCVAADHVVADGHFEPGAAIGPYRIVRQLGAGGMGVVYLAERFDGSTPEHYAIKIMRWWSHGLMRRFRQEQTILGNLHHPNIARLIDTGATDDQNPYLVMEYVDGVPIHQFCEERAYSVTDRLRLFRDVCRAVQYLHQNLVVHRDLKPSNVMVTPEGIIKLLDFGIAKPLPGFDGATSFTQTLAGLMTPDYASPEQIRGEPVSTLTDVYSLGVLLYELLAGSKPFCGSREHLHEKLRRICEEEPERPSIAVSRKSSSKSQAARQLSGELDNIIVKAMQKDSARRYGSVERFDEDLRRYLEGLPVLAQGDSVFYRGRKFIARHQVGMAATAAILMLLAGGVIAITAEAGIARRERLRAQAEARAAERAQAAAERGALLAKQEQLRAEQETTEAKRQKANAERHLKQIRKVANNAIRAYTAGNIRDLPPDISALIAEIARDSLSSLERERLLEPKLAPVLDAATLDVRGNELATDNSWRIPAGWSAAASRPGLYRVGIDQIFRYEGKATVFVRSLVPRPLGGALVFQKFRARHYWGRRVRLQGSLRADKADFSSVALILQIDDVAKPARVYGTGPWKKYEIVADVGADAEVIGFGIQFSRAGTVWVGNLSFGPVDSSIPLTIGAPVSLEKIPPVLPSGPQNLDFASPSDKVSR